MKQKKINCKKCNKVFMINNNIIENYDICDSCYDINMNVSQDFNYFNKIDTIEKAYLLGLFCKKINKNTITVNNIRKNEDIYIIKLIKQFAINIEYYYSNPKANYVLTFNISSEILNDINNNLKNFFEFENNDDDIKIAFIRGYYEGTKIFSENNNSVKISYDNIENILKIINYINIPYKLDIKNQYITYDSGCNSLDFLGKIYNDCGNLYIKFYKSLLRKFVNCKVFKTDKNAILPSKARESDVGYDLTIIKEVKKFNDKTTLYDTGIKIELEDYYYAKVVPRSSLSKSGYILANSIGIIDNSYRGNLLIALTKTDEKSPDIELPFKCCQLIVEKQIYLDLYEVEEDFNETNRNSGGFGSTG